MPDSAQSPPPAALAATSQSLGPQHRVLLPLLAGALLIGGWYAIKSYWQIHSLILPAPHEVLAAAHAEWQTLLNAALTTLGGALLGFVLASLLGFLGSVCLAASSRLRAAVYPYVVIMQMMPLLATAAIIVILLGTGLHSVVVITFVISFFPVLAATLHGLCAVPAPQLDRFRLYRARRWQEMWLLRVPYALPNLCTGMKIAATLAVIGAVTGEIFAGSYEGHGGLGFLIMVYKAELKTAAVYAATAVCCLLGATFVGGVWYLRWLLLHSWHDSTLHPDS
jgi:NitT/TauT family transport system permease protein